LSWLFPVTRLQFTHPHVGYSLFHVWFHARLHILVTHTSRTPPYAHYTGLHAHATHGLHAHAPHTLPPACVPATFPPQVPALVRSHYRRFPGLRVYVATVCATAFGSAFTFTTTPRFTTLHGLQVHAVCYTHTHATHTFALCTLHTHFTLHHPLVGSRVRFTHTAAHTHTVLHGSAVHTRFTHTHTHTHGLHTHTWFGLRTLRGWFTLPVLVAVGWFTRLRFTQVLHVLHTPPHPLHTAALAFGLFGLLWVCTRFTHTRFPHTAVARGSVYTHAFAFPHGLPLHTLLVLVCGYHAGWFTLYAFGLHALRSHTAFWVGLHTPHTVCTLGWFTVGSHCGLRLHTHTRLPFCPPPLVLLHTLTRPAAHTPHYLYHAHTTRTRTLYTHHTRTFWLHTAGSVLGSPLVYCALLRDTHGFWFTRLHTPLLHCYTRLVTPLVWFSHHTPHV